MELNYDQLVCSIEDPKCSLTYLKLEITRDGQCSQPIKNRRDGLDCELQGVRTSESSRLSKVPKVYISLSLLSKFESDLYKLLLSLYVKVYTPNNLQNLTRIMRACMHLSQTLRVYTHTLTHPPF